ncbi:hypothetical protein Aduo_015474 [Ancylostoma duodenale]
MDHLANDQADGPPGQRVILPSSFQGSPRAMHQSYQDAMAIDSSDRPDLVERVFHQELKVLHVYLLRKHVLGRVAAYVAVVEWQKRGLPHCHMLLIMTTDAKPRNPEQVDAAVQAHLPNPDEDNRLFGIVVRNMVHRRCGATNPTAPCMVDGRCSKGYPKDFREATEVNVDGYPKYKRPNDGLKVTIGGEDFETDTLCPTTGTCYCFSTLI